MSNNNDMKSMSIRTKIIIALVGLSLMSLAAVSLIVGIQVHDELKQQGRNQLIRIVSDKSAEYNLIFKRLSDEAKAVKIFAAELLQRDEELVDTGRQVLMPWTDKGTGKGFNKGYGSEELNLTLIKEIPKVQRIGDMLLGIASTHDLITLAYFASTDGIFVGDGDSQIEKLRKLKGYTPSKRSWYKLAVSEGRTIWSEPYIGASTKELLVTVATPVYARDSKLLGVVGFDVLLQKIKDDILKIDTGYDGYTLLVSNTGQALVSPDIVKGDKDWDQIVVTEDLLKTANTSWNSIVSNMVKQQIGIGEFKEKEVKYLAYAPVNALNASVGLVVSESDVVAPVNKFLYQIAAVAALISSLAIVIGIFLGNSISRPILELTKLVNQMSYGKKGLMILKTKRKDEIGLLTEAYNRLVNSLKIALNMHARR